AQATEAGLPRSRGSTHCSKDAKNSFMLIWTILRARMPQPSYSGVPAECESRRSVRAWFKYSRPGCRVSRGRKGTVWSRAHLVIESHHEVCRGEDPRRSEVADRPPCSCSRPRSV